MFEVDGFSVIWYIRNVFKLKIFIIVLMVNVM